MITKMILSSLIRILTDMARTTIDTTTDMIEKQVSDMMTMPATQTTIKILFNSQSVIAVTTTLDSVKVVSTNKMTTTQVSDIKIMTLDTVRVPSIMPKILM